MSGPWLGHRELLLGRISEDVQSSSHVSLGSSLINPHVLELRRIASRPGRGSARPRRQRVIDDATSVLEGWLNQGATARLVELARRRHEQRRNAERDGI